MAGIKKVSKVDFYSTVDLLIQEQGETNYIFGNFYDWEDLFSGMYDYDLVTSYEIDIVTKEETKACEDLLDFIENRVSVNTRFDDVYESYYDWNVDEIVLSPRVSKIRKIAPNVKLTQLILISYLRSLAIRETYLGKEYCNILNSTIARYKGCKRVHNVTGEVSTITKVPKIVWDKLLMMEFRIELKSWQYIDYILRKDQYHVANEGYISKDDYTRIKRYYLYKKVCQLSAAREKRELRFLENHKFRY